MKIDLYKNNFQNEIDSYLVQFHMKNEICFEQPTTRFSIKIKCGNAARPQYDSVNRSLFL